MTGRATQLVVILAAGLLAAAPATAASRPARLVAHATAGLSSSPVATQHPHPGGRPAVEFGPVLAPDTTYRRTLPLTFAGALAAVVLLGLGVVLHTLRNRQAAG